MRFVIDEDVCKEKDVGIQEVLIMLLIKTGANIPILLNNMEKKEMVVKQPSFFGSPYMVTQRWDDVCANVLLTSDKAVPKEDRIEDLARKLIAIFPAGKKPGTVSTYWRGNVKDTTLRLKKFFKLYGDKFSDEEILQAAQNYVDSFNGNYEYMRTLKYFIWKDARKQDAEGNNYIEEVSDLATFMENGDDKSTNNDWTSLLK